jgi:hypothetical protein
MLQKLKLVVLVYKALRCFWLSRLVVLVYKALRCFWLSLNEPCFMHIDTINISSNALCAFLFLKYSISMSEHSKFFPINCDMHLGMQVGTQVVNLYR